MVTQVIKKYVVMFYGSPTGYMTNRSQVICYDAQNKLIAWIRFNDPGQNFENDSEAGGKIKMHMPSSSMVNVMDTLRNEKPVYIYFAQGRGFLTTSKEPVGEEESRAG